MSESEQEVSDTPCPKCGAMMVVKSGKFGKFLACPNYPECKSTLPFGEKKEDVLDGVCPDCGKPMRRLRTKTGKIYYGCSGYPECKFMSWDIPTGAKCPVCGSPIVKTPKGVEKCSQKGCAYNKGDKSEEQTEKHD